MQVGPASAECLIPADLSSITGVVDVLLTVGERTWSGRGSVIAVRCASETGPVSTVVFDLINR